MRVFIAGSTGAIGLPVVRQLLDRGHHVTATTRSADKAGRLRALGADGVVVDGLDAAAVGEAVARCRPDAIIHQMTALAGRPDLRRFDRWFAVTNRLRTEGTDHLLAAAKATGVKRFIAQSYTGWTTGPTGGPITTEDDPLDANPAKAQAETLAAIRYLENAVLSASLDGVVLRYGSFYGPGASEALVEMVRKRRMPLVGDGGGVWSWIHVDDAAAATVIALERARPGVYSIVDDDPAPVAAWLPHLAAVLGAKPPLRVPAWLARVLAGEVVVRSMTRGRGASNEKARRQLDWTPRWRSWRDGFRDGLAAPARAPAPTHGLGRPQAQDAR